jgi:hypothetical protein
MKLIEALNEINSNDDYDDIMTIYARKEWNEDSETIIVPQSEDGNTQPINGHSYFLEVSIVKGWLEERNEKKVTPETCHRIIQYAINDA